MNITKTAFRAVNQLYLRPLILVAFCAILLTACGGDTPEPTPTVAPTDAPEPAVAATVEPTEEPEEHGAESPSVDAEATASEDSATVDSADIRAPQDLWAAMACSACHRLDEDQNADNIGQPGPHMGNLHETAGSRVDGLSAMEYVVASIVAPNDFINEGYIANVMPQNFGETMSEAEFTSLAEWILDPNREE